MPMEWLPSWRLARSTWHSSSAGISWKCFATPFAGGLIGGWLESKVGVKRALLVEIMLMVLAGLTQLSITRETLFLGLIENSQVWDGPVFQTLSDIVYLSLISVVAITVTASISSEKPSYD